MRLLQRYALRPYQVEAGRAILASVLERRGLTFSVMMARQGGKNELSAQLEVLLLALFAAHGGNGVKTAPTLQPQLLMSIRRLKERLADAGLGAHWQEERGAAVRLGRAHWLFLSGEPRSNVMGATAHLLLEVDEAQDMDIEKYEREFRPMGAATGVTTVLYGTAWDDRGLLEQARALHQELERRDGVRRHFEYDWEVIAAYNPAYRRYVEGERERLGEHHPLFQTQYCLRAVAGGGRFLSPTQLALLRGEHPRQRQPSGGLVVAGLDVAGGMELGEVVGDGRTQPSIGQRSREQDATVLTLAEVEWEGTTPTQPWPQVRVVDHLVWRGVPHAALLPQLVGLLKGSWRCQRVAVDATGVGEGLSSLLRQALGSRVVVPFRLSAPAKSQLGFDLLAAVNAGRVKLYRDDGSEESRACWWELEHARCLLRPNRTLAFSVDPVEGHDDYLMSLALVVAAAQQSVPRQAIGRRPDG